MKLAHFPQDIVNLIISDLRDDTLTLRQCGLVCWSWAEVSQRHLFAKADFAPYGWTELPVLYERFSSLLTKNPTISTYVRSLRLLVYPRDSNLYQFPQWEPVEGTLITILRQLCNLESFEFAPCSKDGVDKSDFCFGSPFYETLQTFLERTPLKTLVLSGWSFSSSSDFTDVMGCVYIPSGCLIFSHLTLTNFDSLNDTWLDSAKGKKDVGIDALYIVNSHSDLLISWLLNHQNRLHPKSLHLIHKYGTEPSEQLMRLVTTPQIEHLHIHGQSVLSPFMEHTNIGKFTGLHTLSLALFVSPYFDHIPNLVRLLCNATEPNSIKYIKIQARFADIKWEPSYFTGWQAVDTTLTRPAFAHLKAVHIDAFVARRKGIDEIVRNVIEVMPSLRSRGILFIREATESPHSKYELL